ncbi:MAG: hypothetical protein WAL66_13620 [Nitrososphaeraceae archaeon]
MNTKTKLTNGNNEDDNKDPKQRIKRIIQGIVEDNIISSIRLKELRS